MRSSGPRARHPLGRHFGAQSFENVSGETGRTTSRAASQSPGFRGCLRRNGPDHVSRGISESRFWRMSQAKRAGPRRARRLKAQSLEDVSSETGRTTSCAAPEAQRFGDVSGETAWTTSRAASQSPELRGCLRRSGPEHLSRGISEPRVARMSQAKLAVQSRTRHLGA